MYTLEREQREKREIEREQIQRRAEKLEREAATKRYIFPITVIIRPSQ